MVVDMERVMSFVTRLIDAGLVRDINDPESRFDPWNWFDDHQELNNGRYKIFSGACKGVIVFDDTDYVIKFDYYGSQSYCKMEAEYYADAVKAGLELYFAETRIITEVDGIVFTIQEQCVCDEDEVYNSVRRYVEETGCRDLSEDDIWAEVDDLCENGLLYKIFNDDALRSFICSHYINDLHQGNFGFIGERLVMTDFSGF